MAIQSITAHIKGIDSLLQSNPQVVDPFNPFSVQLSEAVKIQKKSPTPENIQRVRELEIASKIFFDEELGIYVPGTWVTEAIVTNAFAIAKIAKKKARSAVFTTNSRLQLKYAGSEAVKTPQDIIGNTRFHHIRVLPQGQVRVCKAIPIFCNWSFDCELEFDDAVISAREIRNVLTYAGKYGGFGDFRPTHGRATVEFSDE